MKLVKLQCPNCGGKLKVDPTEKSATCKYCGTTFLIDDERVVNQTINNYYGTTPNKSGVIISIFLICCLLLAAPVLILTNAFDDGYPNTEVREEVESEQMKTFLSLACEKEYDDITKKDIKQIKYIKLKYNSIGNGSCYQFDFSKTSYDDPTFNQSIKSVFVYDDSSSSSKIESKDLEVLTGLEVMDISENSVSGSYATSLNFSNLKNLKEIKGSLTISSNMLDKKNFASYKNIKTLSVGVSSDIDVDDFKGFTNLQNLTIDCSGNSKEPLDFSSLKELRKLKSLTIICPFNENRNFDISSLSTLNNLKSLSILNASNVNDYSCLYSLTNLEELSLGNAKALKDISFINNLSKLNSLTIGGSGVLDFNILSNKVNITYLCLIENENVSDYQFLSTLTNLQELFLSNAYHRNSVTGSVSNITSLKKASVDNYSQSIIANNQSIEDLTLGVNFDIDDGENFTNMNNVRKLSIEGNSSDFNADILNNFPNLNQLNMKSVDLKNADTLIKRNLNKLTIIDGSLCNVSKDIKFNPSLQELNIINVSITSETYNSDLDFSNYANAFSDLVNTKRLSVINEKIKNLDFIKNLNNLEYLDFSYNYINNCNPLKDKKIKITNLKNNSVNSNSLKLNILY